MKKVIVAPLNWGLGHATRCIPVINALSDNEYTPVIASDGAALTLLKKEFPQLESIELPTYGIRYGKYIRFSLVRQLPKILRAVYKEHRLIEKYISGNQDVFGIISDNRFGVRSRKVPSVYITHQLSVLSGKFTWLTSKIHRSIINGFDECWIPDDPKVKFSGKLSNSLLTRIPVKYIGLLSRMNRTNSPVKNDVLIVLSGPEPNRSYLEKRLLADFQDHPGKITLIRGIVEDQFEEYRGTVRVLNYAGSQELEQEINASELIVCRSGYSSIMDLAVLGKKAFFIPTTGQSEQEYLAKLLESKAIAPYVKEEKFDIIGLSKVHDYKGFTPYDSKFENLLLNLFKGE